MQIESLMADPAMLIAAAVIGLGLLGLIAEALLSSMRGGAKSKSKTKSPIVLATTKTPRAVQAPLSVEAPKPVFTVVEPVAPAEAAPPAPPKDTLAEQRRFFVTLGAALSSTDEATQVTLAALQANLSAEVFMERMTLATKGWKPVGFGTGGRNLLLKAEGTPPDMVASKVLEGYEQLKLGHAKEALDAFLAGIDAANAAATADAASPWPHAWSAFAWRGLALIAEESGDVQATLAGLKVAYQSMVNAFEITTQLAPEKLAQAA